jgi:hypothetical protein
MKNIEQKIARISVLFLLITLAGIFACSSDEESNGLPTLSGVLAYGGLDLLLGVDDVASAAKLSLLSEPVTAANGVTILEASAVMEDLRLIMSPGNEVRWQHQHQEHWSRGEDDDEDVDENHEHEDDDDNDVNHEDDDDDDNSEELDRSGDDSDSNMAAPSADDEIEEENERSDLDGPFYFDLIEGVSVPTIETGLLPAGVYNTIIFRLGDTSEVDGLDEYGIDPTSPIMGNSIYLAGNLTVNEEAIDFIALFADDDQSSYKLELTGELTIEPDIINTLIVNFDVASWADVLDLPGLYDAGQYETDQAGVVIFSIEDSDLRNAFRHRFCNSLRAGVDRDGDRKMGQDEELDLQAEPEDGTDDDEEIDE